ncbi:hypothetical protein ACSLBF_20215 (plasmid) [Pseudoalteromonas sp. T1lg65]|uniref:hypothetical protein n=1 Tax=Pseudoalteromonas sp. T1lg65 TaxID=2077101 RepID=UPI003F7AB99F
MKKTVLLSLTLCLSACGSTDKAEKEDLSQIENEQKTPPPPMVFGKGRLGETKLG